MIDEPTLERARRALPEWVVQASPSHPEQMRFSRLTGAEKVSGVVFDAPSVFVARRVARSLRWAG